jgi:hypothetical protein
MKRSLLAAAAMVLMATTANAEDLKVSGNWKAFRETVDGRPVCGMSSEVSRETGGNFYLKYYYGDHYLTGQVIKSSWQFPDVNNAIDIPLTVGVDRNPILSGKAIGYTQSIKWHDGKTYQMPTLEFVIQPEKTNIDGFLNDLSLANKFWLRFDEGSEKPWVLDMTGSAAVAMVFRACTLELLRISKAGDPPATQPYGQSQPTQPYGRGAAPSQPYGNAQPSQPFGGSKPAAKANDGGI